MGLEQKLSQLDELIWKQFEKVTQKADSYLGWDKYDLARGSVNVALAGSLAFTVYSGINWAKYDHAGMATGLGVVMMYVDLSYKKEVAKVEQFDSQLLQKGMMVSPIYRSRRPLTFVLTSIILGAVARVVPEITSNEDVQFLYNLGLGAKYLSILGTFSASYFSTQLPKPPRSSPGKFLEWYSGLKEALGMKGAVDANGVKCVDITINGGL